MEHLPTVAWSSWRDVTSKDTVDAPPTRERVAIPAKRTGDVVFCAMHVFGNSTYTLRVETRNQYFYWLTSFYLGYFFVPWTLSKFTKALFSSRIFLNFDTVILLLLFDN